MKVFVVIKEVGDYDESSTKVLGVYSTQELANVFVYTEIGKAQDHNSKVKLLWELCAQWYDDWFDYFNMEGRGMLEMAKAQEEYNYATKNQLFAPLPYPTYWPQLDNAQFKITEFEVI